MSHSFLRRETMAHTNGCKNWWIHHVIEIIIRKFFNEIYKLSKHWINIRILDIGENYNQNIHSFLVIQKKKKKFR